MTARARTAAVIGAGVVGRLCALTLARAGWRVELLHGGGASASAAAAGMIAPASEALLDDVDAVTAQLWRAAGSRWRGFATGAGLKLAVSGSLHLASRAELDRRQEQATALGFASSRSAEGLFLPEDAHLEAPVALAALQRAGAAAGVRTAAQAVEAGESLHAGGAALEADVIVVAAGWGAAALARAAPELRALRPIKGQLLRLAGPPAFGPALRTPDVYLVPGPSGWTAGATMEEGREDLRPDPVRLAELRAAAIAIRPELAQAPVAPNVGVRAAAPDGAPLVGWSASGLLLATGLRRNGWLLGPLVADAVAAYAEGRDPDAVLGGQAAAWSPARLAPTTQGPA